MATFHKQGQKNFEKDFSVFDSKFQMAFSNSFATQLTRMREHRLFVLRPSDTLAFEL